MTCGLGLPFTKIGSIGGEAGFRGRLKTSGLDLDSAKIHRADGLASSYLKYAFNNKGNQQNSIALGKCIHILVFFPPSYMITHIISVLCCFDVWQS